MDASSSIVCAVFLCTGAAFLLWYKLKTQPSPATMALVLSCILLDVVRSIPVKSLTTVFDYSAFLSHSTI